MSEKGRHALREKFRGLRKRTKVAIVGLLVVPLVAAGAVAANAVTADQVTPEGRIAAKWFDVCVSPDGRNPRFIMENQSCGGSSIHYRWAGSAHPKIQDGKSAYAQWAEAQGDADTSLDAYFQHIAAMADGGVEGPEGKSAYALAVEAGFEGTLEQWLESLKGDKGDKGDAGDPGAPGEAGPQGEPGLTNLESDGPYPSATQLADGANSTAKWVADGGAELQSSWVQCAEGKTAIGGGFSRADEGTEAFKGLHVVTSQPVQIVDGDPTAYSPIEGDADGSYVPNGWLVEGFNDGETDLIVRPHVVCADVNTGGAGE